MHKCNARWVLRILTPTIREIRVACYRELITLFDDPTVDCCNRIVTGGDTWVRNLWSSHSSKFGSDQAPWPLIVHVGKIRQHLSSTVRSIFYFICTAKSINNSVNKVWIKHNKMWMSEYTNGWIYIYMYFSPCISQCFVSFLTYHKLKRRRRETLCH